MCSDGGGGGGGGMDVRLKKTEAAIVCKYSSM